MASLPDDAKVLGMEASKLQSNVTVDGDNVLHGTSHYVKKFTAYDEGAEGNFVAMKVVAPDGVTVKITTSAVQDKPLDEDRTLIWKVTSQTDTLKVTVEDGEKSSTAEYRADGLTLEKDPLAVVATAAGQAPAVVTGVNTSVPEDAPEARKTASGKKAPTLSVEVPKE